MPPKFRRDYPATSREPERQALLEGNSDDEDFFLRGPDAQPGRLIKDDKLNRLQGQVDDVVDVMHDNIGRVLDRGERLEDLQDKSENLTANADMFHMRSKGLRTRMWWRECRMRLLIALVVVIILTIIIVPIIVKYTKKT